MSDVLVFLRLTAPNEYGLFGPKGNLIVEFGRLRRDIAIETAENYISSFASWGLKVEC